MLELGGAPTTLSSDYGSRIDGADLLDLAASAKVEYTFPHSAERIDLLREIIEGITISHKVALELASNWEPPRWFRSTLPLA